MELVDDVRAHYDRVSPLYRLFWGDHIHHGFWEGDESVEDAQIKLMEKLVETAGLRPGSRVLDIGCGVGGASVWLARNHGCSVVGLTLSPVQARLAGKRAAHAGVSARTEFRVTDANALDEPAGAFDAVWVVECSEHITDKRRFIDRCARALRPGGVLALCAWLDGSRSEADRTLVADICDRMICPSLGRLEDYRRWMAAGGLEMAAAEDITARVARTWDLCAKLIRRPDVRLILRAVDEKTRRFAGSFEMMREAYASGAMGYGMFAARKVSV
jgi:tocopherol O-methyltransferase